MDFQTEKEVRVTFLGAEYVAQCQMMTVQERTACFEASGYNAAKAFRYQVREVSGPPINGKQIKTGKDIVETRGADGLFAAIQAELIGWEPEAIDEKN